MRIFWRITQVCIAVLLLSMLYAIAVGEANAVTHSRKPLRVRRDSRAFPPSKASLLAQNAAIDELGLHRYENDAEISAGELSGELVHITCGTCIIRVPDNRRLLRKPAADTLAALSHAFYMQWGHPVTLTSAIRTRDTQRSLRRWNHNAAPVKGPLQSSHLAGTTFDIGRKNFTRAENRWMELYLYGLGDAVIVEEENGQKCFHVMVKG